MPDTNLPSDPNMELVVVLETNEPLAFALAKGSLEEAGIPFFAHNEIALRVPDIDPMLRKWLRVEVPRDREAEARDLLAPLLSPAPPAEQVGETQGQ